MHRLRCWAPQLALAAVVLPATTAAPQDLLAPAGSAAPEQLSAPEAGSRYGMVVSGSREASSVGAQILEAGGNAVDAAVAAALALGVAEPGQSGLGGQTYMLICPRGGRCVAIDGSCLVPLRVSRPELQRLTQQGGLFGYKVAAAPGTLAALDFALARYGSMKLAQVLEPVIALADVGATFTPNQLHFLDAYIDKAREQPYLANLFLDDGLFLRPLERVYCNPDLGCTLRRIAAGGASTFYAGAIADEIEADMVANGGYLRKADLGRIAPVELEPLRSSYRGIEVVSFPTPGAGAALIVALNILERFPAAALRGYTAESFQLQIEATRLGIAAEPAVTRRSPGITGDILDKQFAAAQARRIVPGRALTPEELGPVDRVPWLDRDTTQLSVADSFGNVVSLTQTLGQGFGGCVATPGLGFPYNSILAAFDLDHPRSRGYLAPLRRLLTSMAPTVLLREGRPFLVLGGVGTARITSSMVLTIVNLVDRGMSLKEAVGAPRVLWGDAPESQLSVELGGGLTDELVEALKRTGYTNVRAVHFPATQSDLGWQGGVNAITVDDDGRLVGVGDPRRQGAPVPARPPSGHAVGGASLTPCWRNLWNAAPAEPR